MDYLEQRRSNKDQGHRTQGMKDFLPFCTTMQCASLGKPADQLSLERVPLMVVVRDDGTSPLCKDKL
jgi:hypothetical protein